MKNPELMIVFGTRPEAVKLAPVIRALRDCPGVTYRIVATGQHREILRQAIDFFDIPPDVSLDIMRSNQDLFDVTVRALDQLRDTMRARRPDAVIVQGDTTTAYCAALAAFYNRIPVGHVEAGLRSGDRFNPYPEEFNRRAVGSIAEWHFAPTTGAAANVIREGARSDRVFVTGNTIVDALQWVVRDRRNALPESVHGVSERMLANEGKRLILVTCHRRETFGEELRGICGALRELADTRRDVLIGYPVHPNPNVTAAVDEMLRGHERIVLMPPLDYVSFITLMLRAEIILTDSGGVQEEAPSFGKPVLVLRKTTERPEGVAAGVARLVGTDRAVIIHETLRLLDDPQARLTMAAAQNPYGDGMAARRIVEILDAELNGTPSSGDIFPLQAVPTSEAGR